MMFKAVFYGKNATMHVKVVALLNESNTEVKEHDVSSKFVTELEIVFNTTLAENLMNEECS